MMKLPTFLIVGVQKAGTTSIYNYLQEHPQVFMSRIKETNFLEQDWSSFPPEKQNKNGIVTIEDYAALFTDVRDEIAIGEASPNYLFHYESSAARIKKYVPDAKLIVVLRNPVERAYSDYLMHIRDAIGTQIISLSEQVEKRAHKSFMIRKGFYATPLKYYLDQFGTEQIKVCLYDDLCRNSEQFMKGIYTYIGVDTEFKPDVSKKVQQAKVPKNQAINNLLQRKNPLRTFAANTLKTVMPLEARQKFRDRLININSQSKKEMPLTTEDSQKLINLYQEDILKLQDLINRDLSGWLQQ
ncbi:Sulfotransferase [Hyella patelloides LEGE 07179]|uniref:Sulfotransferase n=1 Tax=Hyella patelloides LEGE 07179 TaxID=945734 RepID=A0A563VVV1_9CYAN|nr:sulfotransferase [Hyella patelloides]VEP15588.1 Sulfotransferase [Hyella patelloides LEGE 07179]